MRILSFSLLLLLSTTALSVAEPRAFTDTTGREIVAEMVAVRGDNVTIDISGREYTLPISKFSESDVSFIQEWGAANPAPLAITGLSMEFEKETGQIKPEKADDTAKAKKDKGKGGKKTEKTVDYVINIRNSSDQAIPDFKVQYSIYKLVRVRSSGTTRSSSEHLNIFQEEESPGTLEGLAQLEVATKTMILTDADESNKKTGDKSSKSETLWGMVVRLYSGDQEILVDTIPDGLERRINSYEEAQNR